MGCASSVAAGGGHVDAAVEKGGKHAGQQSRLVGSLSARGGLDSRFGVSKGRTGTGTAGRDSSSRTSKTAPGDVLIDPTWRSPASALAGAALPFVPARVWAAFADGRLAQPLATGGDGEKEEGQLGVTSPPPHAVTGVLLILDISGFTALSQDARRRLGSEGVERFSLAISAFFSVMLPLIVQYRGDVDCFAGDAVLVFFEVEAADQGRGLNLAQGATLGQTTMEETVHRALECAQALHSRLDGFQHEPDDPPLRVHSALAAGELMCVECGGELAQRYEAFLLGSPLLEIAPALKESGVGQIVLAPGASSLLGTHKDCRGTGIWDRSELASGCTMFVKASTSASQHSATSAASQKLSRIVSKEYGCLVGDSQALNSEGTTSEDGTPVTPVDRVVARMHKVSTTDTAVTGQLLSGSSFMEAFPPGKRGRPSTKRTSSRLSMRRTSSKFFGDQVYDSMGLDALLRFMPDFVRSKCIARHNHTTLMEHRVVTILFVVADMKEHESKFTDAVWISQLQSSLGQSINTVEAQLGGSTRQICMDDKGMALIFAFGLPGYLSNRQSVPSIVAARKVLEHLAAAGIRGFAGISAGMCFCGLVGDPSIRCEYAVMGDFVNTAARLAVAGAKQGYPIMCTEAVYNATTFSHLALHRLTLRPAGSMELKGKQGKVRTYTPGQVPSVDDDCLVGDGAPVRMVGRDSEMALLQRAVGGSVACAAGVVLVVVEGEAGVGKSALADAVMQQVLSGGTHKWLLVRGTEYDDSTPLLACRTILHWLLQLQGEPRADTMSWLLGDFSLDEGSMPALLRPHAADIRALSSDHKDMMLKLQEMYARLIWEALQQGGVAVLLEDVDALDMRSNNVLGSLAARHADAALKGAEGSSREGAPGILLCTSRLEDMLTGTEPVAAGEEPPHPRSAISLRLAPVRPEAVQEMARDYLGSTLDQPVADLIVGRSNGIPLQVVELCAWLRTEQLVIDGRLSTKAAGLEVINCVPPNLQAIVQAQVDVLALVPGVVLRCASVLGVQFTTHSLLGMLPAEIVPNQDELEEQLGVLFEAHLIERAARFRRTTSLNAGSSHDADSTWKFCNRMHQEVVYNSIPHKYRRKLHAKAADFISEQMQQTKSNYLELRPVLRALTSHLLRSLPSGDSSKGQQYSQLGGRQLHDLTSSLGKAAKNSQAVGDYEEAVAYWGELLNILQEQNDIAAHSVVELLVAESRAVENATKCFLTLSLYNIKVEGIADPKQRLQELETRQATLQETIAELSKGPAKVAGSTSSKPPVKRESSFTLLVKRLTSDSPNFKLVRRVTISAKFTSTGLEFVSNMGFVKSATLQSLMAELEGESTMKGRTYISTNICTTLMNQATCWERLSMGAKAYETFQGAGLPHRLSDVPGYPSSINILALWLSGQLWSGQVDGSAEAATKDTIPNIDRSQVGYLITLWECAEASWEPLSSPRVQSQRKQREAAGSPNKPWDHMANCMHHLHDAVSTRAALGPEAFQDSNEMALAGVLSLLRSAVTHAGNSVEVGAHMSQSCVVMACVTEGCRILFPSEAAPASTPPAALRHLAGVAEQLSRCLRLWARRAANVFGYSFLPSTMMWGRSMLHLFQWWLLCAGADTEGGSHGPTPEPVHLTFGPRLKRRTAGPARNGPAQAAAGLLLAQRHAATRGELLPGCLPATVALARLLLAGAGQCEPALEAELRATKAVVPVTLPPFSREGDASPVLVRHVQFGSHAAAQVAAAHLGAVLSSVAVAGKPLRPEEVDTPADVAGSTSLWEAVDLLRAAQRMLASARRSVSMARSQSRGARGSSEPQGTGAAQPVPGELRSSAE